MATPGTLTVHTGNQGMAMPSTSSRPIVYQIDFTAVASGKRIASTKRRVRWRFGFANPEALAAGETGTACRGEEHDVTLVWSITSGKRLLLADGQEVHYSNSRGNVFDFSWTMRGNHVLKVVAHASPPLSATPGFRQYDFFVDGQSFFTFPKVYRLGLAPNDPRVASPQAPVALASSSRGGYSNYSVGGASSARPVNIQSVEAPTNPDEEEAYLREAIKQSLEDAPPDAAPGGAAQQNGEKNLLLDFFDEAPAPAVPALPAPAPADAFAYAQPAPQPAAQQFLALPPPAPAADAYAAPPQPAYDQFAAPPPAQPYGAPAPAQQPYGGFMSPGVPAAPATVDFTSPPNQQTPSSLGFSSPPADQFASPPPQTYAPAPEAAYAPGAPFGAPAPEAAPEPAPAPVDPALLTMNALSGQESLVSGATSGGGSLADQIYNKFANMDNFDLVSKSDSKRANPFEAPASTVGGTQSLADMQSAKSGEGATKKEIMKAAPGAIVVSGTQQGNWGGGGGGYGAAPMAQPPYGQQQQQQQPPAYGAPPQQPGMYGAPPQYGQPQQPQYGQPPPPQYGQQPQYGQPPPPQPGYGAPYQQGY